MAVQAIPLIISAASSLYKMYQAGQQKNQAKELLGEYKRPYSEVPQGIIDMIDINKNLASSELPGMDLAKENIMGSTQAGLSAIRESGRSSSDVIGASTSLFSSEQDKMKELGVVNAQNKVANQLQLAKVLGDLAGYQEKNFMLNDYQPYLSAMTAARNLSNAGIINQYQGIKDISGILANSYPELAELFKSKNKTGGVGTDLPYWDSIGVEENTPFDYTEPKDKLEIPELNLG
jgi:hypothetical protein